MSMRNYGNHGYVVKAEELTKLLLESSRESFQIYIANGDWESAHDLLLSDLPDKFPKPESCFVLNDECESEDLELNKMYVYWDEEQLFERKMTSQMDALFESNIKPQLANWVTFS